MSIPSTDFRSGSDAAPVRLSSEAAVVLSLKQVLWYAGLLATKAHPSAGRGATAYQPQEDFWGLNERFAGRVVARGG